MFGCKKDDETASVQPEENDKLRTME